MGQIVENSKKIKGGVHQFSSRAIGGDKGDRSMVFSHPFSSFDGTGFPKKDGRFSKLKNIPDLLRNDREGKIM